MPTKEDIMRMTAYQLRAMPVGELNRIRNSPEFAKDQQIQDLLGPYEHGDFVRDVTGSNPLVGYGALLATPVYSGLKGLRQAGVPMPEFLEKHARGRSKASVSEMVEALRGFGGGVVQSRLNPLVQVADAADYVQALRKPQGPDTR